MTWFGWFLLAYWALNALLTINLVGKHRKPIDPAVAAVSVFIYALLMAGVAFVGTQR